jgi:hypothetical protein
VPNGLPRVVVWIHGSLPVLLRVISPLFSETEILFIVEVNPKGKISFSTLPLESDLGELL